MKAFREDATLSRRIGDRTSRLRVSVVSRKRRRILAPQSFVAGLRPRPTMQISVKGLQNTQTARGWGCGQFENGVANQSEPLLKSLFCLPHETGHAQRTLCSVITPVTVRSRSALSARSLRGRNFLETEMLKLTTSFRACWE